MKASRATTPVITFPSTSPLKKDGGKGIFKADPFQSLDQSGVGALVKMGIEKGRAANPKLKVGICGEHGGESESVKFCHRVGMNYARPDRPPGCSASRGCGKEGQDEVIRA